MLKKLAHWLEKMDRKKHERQIIRQARRRSSMMILCRNRHSIQRAEIFKSFSIFHASAHEWFIVGFEDYGSKQHVLAIYKEFEQAHKALCDLWIALRDGQKFHEIEGGIWNA